MDYETFYDDQESQGSRDDRQDSSNHVKNSSDSSYARSYKRKKQISNIMEFNDFLTPGFIRMIFIIGVITIVLTSLIFISSGMGQISSRYEDGGAGLVFLGIVTLIFGNIAWRVFCELVIVLFNINNNLVELKKQKKN